MTFLRDTASQTCHKNLCVQRTYFDGLGSVHWVRETSQKMSQKKSQKSHRNRQRKSHKNVISHAAQFWKIIPKPQFYKHVTIKTSMVNKNLIIIIISSPNLTTRAHLNIIFPAYTWDPHWLFFVQKWHRKKDRKNHNKCPKNGTVQKDNRIEAPVFFVRKVPWHWNSNILKEGPSTTTYKKAICSISTNRKK